MLKSVRYIDRRAEARKSTADLAMLQLNLEKNKHNQNLEYQRELDRRKSTENIAAAPSSLVMGFFANH